MTTPLPQLPATSETTLAGRTFEYDLSALPPCGYTVTLTVSDRAIVNSATAGPVELRLARALHPQELIGPAAIAPCGRSRRSRPYGFVVERVSVSVLP